MAAGGFGLMTSVFLAMPSIHPFSATYPWQRAKQGSPDIPLPSNVFHHFLGDPKEFPSQMRCIISPACSGPNQVFPTSWMRPENLQWMVPKRLPDQMPIPPQLAHCLYGPA